MKKNILVLLALSILNFCFSQKSTVDSILLKLEKNIEFPEEMILKQESAFLLVKFSKNSVGEDTVIFLNKAKKGVTATVQQIAIKISKEKNKQDFTNDFIVPILFLYVSNKAALFDQDLSEVYRLFRNQNKITITKPILITGSGPLH